MESLAESPAVMTHASVPKEIRAELGKLLLHNTSHFLLLVSHKRSMERFFVGYVLNTLHFHYHFSHLFHLSLFSFLYLSPT